MIKFYHTIIIEWQSLSCGNHTSETIVSSDVFIWQDLFPVFDVALIMKVDGQLSELLCTILA